MVDLTKAGHLVRVLWMRFQKMFGMDRRSLATFRFVYGMTIAISLIVRIPYLRVFHTDEGIIPRSKMLEITSFRNVLLVHGMNGQYYFQLTLFLFHILTNLSFAIGFKTRLSAILNFILYTSVASHAPFTNSGADQVARIFCFWVIWMPLSKVWSVDALIKKWNYEIHEKDDKPKTKMIFDGSTFAFIVQLMVLYITSTFHKTGEEWRTTYQASFYALSLTMFQRPLARLMLQLPVHVLQILTWAVLKWELLGTLFYISPIFSDGLRVFGMIGFTLLHIGFGAPLILALFLWIMIALVVPFLPSSVWDITAETLETEKRRKTILWMRSDSFLSKLISRCLDHFFLASCTPRQTASHQDTLEVIDEESLFDNITKSYLALKTPEGLNIFNFNAIVYIFRHLIPLFSLYGWMLSKTPMCIVRAFDSLLLMIHEATIYDQLHFKELKLLNMRKRKAVHYSSRIALILKRSKVVLINVFLVFLIYSVVHHCLIKPKYVSRPIPRLSNSMLDIFQLKQSWGMFSPRPPVMSWYPEMKGLLTNNVTADFYSTGAIIDEHWKPAIGPMNVTEHPADLMRDHRWYKILELGIHREKTRTVAKLFGAYVCREYNMRNRIKLVEFTVDYQYIRNVPGKEPTPAHRVNVLTYKCQKK